MHFIIDKVIMLLLCVILFFDCFPNLNQTVIALLTGLTVCCIQSTVTERRITFFLSAAYYLLTFFFHPFCLFLPAIAYELFTWRNRTLTILTIGAIGAASLLFYPKYILFFCVLYGTGYWMGCQSEHLIKSLKEIILLRDTSAENRILLEQKNKAILETQSAQIYSATLKERNRIAREIHDNVGHLLTRAILQVGALKTINQEPSLSLHFDSLQETLNQAMTNIRSSVHDLHDESIDLKLAVNGLIKEIDAFDVSFDYSMGQHIPKEIKYTFLSIIKEAINNTLKHSNGDKISLTLCEHPAFYQLLFEDNGTNIVKDYQEGMGLLNMEQRIAALSGTFQIRTDAGFRIFISVMKEGLYANYHHR